MCRSRRELSNEYLLAKIDVDTAKNEPSKAWLPGSMKQPCVRLEDREHPPLVERLQGAVRKERLVTAVLPELRLPSSGTEGVDRLSILQI